MKTMESYNPAVAFFYIIVCAVIPVFSVNPMILLISLVFSLCFYIQIFKSTGKKLHIFAAAVFVAVTIINPIFSHNGCTVLFMLDDNPVTLEALLYGVAVAVTVVSSMYWFASLSRIMSTDKIIYVFGSFSPKLALLISMVIRYIPLIKSRAEKVSDAQRLSGKYGSDDYVKNKLQKVKVFSSVVTWSLETGIITADTMEARGYNTAKRTRFALYTFDLHDGALTAVFAALLLCYAVGSIYTKYNFIFYPTLSGFDFDLFCVMQYSVYFILAAIPVVCGLGDKLKWKYLISKI